MNRLLENLSGKKVLIFGLGVQGGGLGDALYLHSKGIELRVTDSKPAKELEPSLSRLPDDIPRTIGVHSMDDLSWADIIIKNPGVPDEHKLIQLARSKDVPIYSSAALFVKYSDSKIIGITGTRGKTTTTLLIYELMKSSGFKVGLGGNIPNRSLLQLLADEENNEYTVLELSSFQLSSFHDLKVSPHIAILTNIYEDHLNRYTSMQEYVEDKMAIMRYQKPEDYLILNRNNSYLSKIAAVSRAHVIDYSLASLPDVLDPHLKGDHNLENIMATYELSRVLKIDDEKFTSTINSFPGVPYRQEIVRTVDGITYINDTTSTTPIATIKAIDTFPGPINLILGGASKNLSLGDLISKLREDKIKSVTVLGGIGNQAITDILASIDKPTSRANSMSEAVNASSAHALPGEIVLLSPGFASFDLFKNEFDRGDQFNKIVRSL